MYSLWVRHGGTSQPIEMCRGLTRQSATILAQQYAEAHSATGADATWSDREYSPWAIDRHSAYFIRPTT
ncbi:MAG: hypothetical protein E6Q97_09550 [Desulfurellales bacterium]|nr:MAG: hypothetical protein E6Q97_09550 [Desulfurellales bacterium]